MNLIGHTTHYETKEIEKSSLKKSTQIEKTLLKLMYDLQRFKIITLGSQVIRFFLLIFVCPKFNGKLSRFLFFFCYKSHKWEFFRENILMIFNNFFFLEHDNLGIEADFN